MGRGLPHVVTMFKPVTSIVVASDCRFAEDDTEEVVDFVDEGDKQRCVLIS